MLLNHQQVLLEIMQSVLEMVAQYHDQELLIAKLLLIVKK